MPPCGASARIVSVCVWEDFLILAEEAKRGRCVSVRCEEWERQDRLAVVVRRLSHP
jgi:hypothetical protein